MILGFKLYFYHVFIKARKSTQSSELGKSVSRWFQTASVKLADVKTDSQWKKSLSLTKKHLATKPETQRRLPVKGQSAPRVTSSVRAVWPFFDWRQTTNIMLAALNRCDIFTTCVTPVIILEDRCAVEIDTTISPLLWRSQAGALRNYEALPYAATLPSWTDLESRRFF